MTRKEVRIMNSKQIIKNETSVFLRCDCGCSTFVVDRTEWSDGDIDYNITVQDSRYDHNYNTLIGRLKSSLKILFGKPVCYSDVYICNNTRKFEDFVKQLNKLCETD